MSVQPFTVGVLSIFFFAASRLFSRLRRSNPPTVIKFPESPVQLPLRDTGKLEPLRKLVELYCPSLYLPFDPPWWLFNGHLQTVYPAAVGTSVGEKVFYNRKFLRTTDGNTLGLDFAPTDWSHFDASTPIVVIQHGLTGGSYEAYVRALLVRVCTPISQGGLGFRAVVVNFRGCAGVPITGEYLYSAGGTDDLRQALYYIAMMYQHAPLLAVGFSLGANVITRYLDEEREASLITSAVALACPWSLGDNHINLISTWVGTFYAKALGANVRRLLQRHTSSLMRGGPDHPAVKPIHAMMSIKNPTLGQYDDFYSRHACGPAPVFPYPSLEAYYKAVSSDKSIGGVRVPFLAINAMDDPIVQRIPMHDTSNPFVVFALTHGGGHLTWLTQNGDRWSTKPVMEWLRLFGEMVVRPPAPAYAPLYVDVDGWIRQKGVDNLGCKEIEFEGGGIIDGTVFDDTIIAGL